MEALPGLTAAKRAVREFGQPDSAVHAVLFYGVRGAGKRGLAEELAKLWISGGDFEGQAAKSFDHGRNADYLIVEPMGPSRIIRDPQITPPKKPPPPSEEFKGVPITDFLRTAPLISSKKVILISDADRLNASAASALLKSLEEPASFAKFVLTTTSFRSLHPTIQSRCAAVVCEVPPDEAEGDTLWKLADGAPGRVEQFRKNESIYQAFWDLSTVLPARKKAEALKASESLRDLADALQKAEGLNARAANAEALELVGTALRHQYPAWHRARTEIAEAHRRIIGNGNAGFVFDLLMARILAG
ncbi:MAG: hypothetical protein H7Y17_11140 [Chlorobia bacterium]|nr:hypothetical protein [Fimbriimonadaceae bacterium]